MEVEKIVNGLSDIVTWVQGITGTAQNHIAVAQIMQTVDKLYGWVKEPMEPESPTAGGEPANN